MAWCGCVASLCSFHDKTVRSLLPPCARSRLFFGVVLGLWTMLPCEKFALSRTRIPDKNKSPYGVSSLPSHLLAPKSSATPQTILSSPELKASSLCSARGQVHRPVPRRAPEEHRPHKRGETFAKVFGVGGVVGLFFEKCQTSDVGCRLSRVWCFAGQLRQALLSCPCDKLCAC